MNRIGFKKPTDTQNAVILSFVSVFLNQLTNFTICNMYSIFKTLGPNFIAHIKYKGRVKKTSPLCNS